MHPQTTQSVIPLSPTDLETLIRRVVREELARLLRTPVRTILEDWGQEGPDDPSGDEMLLAEALAVMREYADKAEAWTSWEDFSSELDAAEARDELPH